ncbi:MAG: hypothetical protein H0T11_03875 [Chthoniobacterales bacterium]|nr:hypothetical protein [Chthoniobacterales bacterium]
MEAFEHIVKVFLESQGYIVTSGVKFPVKLRVKGTTLPAFQTHGFEIDLVAARSDSLKLCSVKSYLGSAGVSREGFKKLATRPKASHLARYALFNSRRVRYCVLRGASRRYGYPKSQICFGLFVGKFVARDEEPIRRYLGGLSTEHNCVEVVGLNELTKQLIKLADHKTYINDPVIVTLKALKAAKMLLSGDATSVAGIPL